MAAKSKGQSKNVYVLCKDNGDSTHDGKFNLIKTDMIEHPSPSKLKIGVQILTKPWPIVQYHGVIVDAKDIIKGKKESSLKKVFEPF